MVEPNLFITGLLGVIGLAATGGGFLYRRDSKQQEDIDDNGEAIEEIDRSFVQLTTRLFGHPEDRSDRGVIESRGERVEEAEENIDSLRERVECVGDRVEENGEAIEHLEEQVTEHAEVTREMLTRIEHQLDGTVSIPDELGEGGD